MIKIGIVDDEPVFCNMMKNILLQKFDNINVYTYSSVNQLDKDFDFILLDINMPDCDGVEFAKKNEDKKILFVSYCDSRCTEAFGPNREKVKVKVNDIIYCVYLGGMNTVIIANDNKQIIVKNKSFKEVLESLGDDFILISRRTAINKNKISSISDKGVYLKGKKRLFNVSRRQRKIVLKAFFESFMND